MDRHFFGLYIVAKWLKMDPMPEIFSDEVIIIFSYIYIHALLFCSIYFIIKKNLLLFVGFSNEVPPVNLSDSNSVHIWL